MSFKILAINPGSTSTKIAIYDDIKKISGRDIEHPNREIAKYDKITAQYEMRYNKIIDFLKENDVDIKGFSAYIAYKIRTLNRKLIDIEF